MKENEEPNKQSTKICPYCESSNMIHYISTNNKQCSDCLKLIYWPLDKGQKKLL